MIIIIFLIALFASVIGAICGIGGGVIIKPVLDLFGVASVSTISFLSGCTVLSMTFYSVCRNTISRAGGIEFSTGTPLAVGAALGGIVGNLVFSLVRGNLGNGVAGAAQSFFLMLLTLGTLIYSKKKAGIQTYAVKNPLVCLVIGTLLGLLSSFLGIGGGPFNLVFLHYFFSMDAKKAALNSLYIIMFSQITNLAVTLLSRSIPVFDPVVLVLMIAGGILGGILGRQINKKIESNTVDRLFIGLLLVIICICIYNTVRYLR